MKKSLIAVMAASLGSIVVTGACQRAPQDDDQEIGVARIALTDVPTGVACIRVTAAGTRVVQKDFMPQYTGESTLVQMNALPIGDVQFTAEAFSTSCQAAGSAVPTWTGGPVSATISLGVVAQVTIVMKRNGRSEVEINFKDTMCLLEGAACSSAAACCTGPNMTASCAGGACATTCNSGFADCNMDKRRDGCEVNLLTDPNNCWSCGFVCPFGCNMGYCQNASLTVDSVLYKGYRMIDSATFPAGVTGPLVYGGLCDTVDPSWAGKVVLCLRGNILFWQKAANVEAGGGLGAAIYNNVPGPFIGTLIGNTPGIPVALFEKADGEFLVANKIGATATFVTR